MQTIIETIQPYVSTVATAILGVLTAIVIAGMNTIKVKANEWINARTTESQRVLLHKLAEEGFSLAKTVFKEADGPKKLQQALSYVTRQLQQRGIYLTDIEIQGAIEKAYLDYKAKQKPINTEEATIADAAANVSTEVAAQAAAKEAMASLAARVNELLSQATAEVFNTVPVKVQYEAEAIPTSIGDVQVHPSTE
ncbi:phage holin [Paenibacillus sp. AK121]|uniref:phage holin n=1 Tax=Paenibacillus TaxID=44249 RepID=UPI001C24A934|nr:phage holin [Paenibacillus sp. AK121]MBU9707120.1 phage holin [Paenibacillus sp. AK121]MEE4566379.1 phage holin [Paenibacillus polymyxa]